MSNPACTVALTMTASEEFTAVEQPNASSAAERTLKFNALNLSASLSATTIPKVDKPPVYRKHTFTSGAAITVDLTAAPCLKSPDSASRAVDMTAAKLKHAQFSCPAGNNAAGVTIAFGAVNPYNLFGASKSIILLPGEVFSMGFRAVESTKPAVGATTKNIDITPGASGDIIELGMVFGT